MRSLKECLVAIPENRTAFATPNRKITYRYIRDIIKANESILESLHNVNVAITSRSSLELAILLFLLDGVAGSILLLPPDIDQDFSERYFTEADVAYKVFLEEGLLKLETVGSNKRNESDYTTWIIPTSGTTNTPKLVAHSFSGLTRTTKVNIENGEKYIWGLVYDVYRFAGLQVFFQAMLSGSVLVIPDFSLPMAEMINFMSESSCNALSATPSFWRKLLMTNGSESLQLKIVTLGGEISDTSILKSLKIAYPNARISHIYASTEAGVGFSVIDGYAGFPEEYLERGVNGISLKISSDGTLMIKSNSFNQKYISKSNIYTSDGYIDTGDFVELRDHRVYFLGRASGAINVGGNKVQPEEIEQFLLSLEHVSAAKVYPRKNSVIGNIVCADIVLKDKFADKKIMKTDIIKSCRENLENFKIPAFINFVEELEITRSGKLKRD